jgi:hypothetical protein
MNVVKDGIAVADFDFRSDGYDQRVGHILAALLIDQERFFWGNRTAACSIGHTFKEDECALHTVPLAQRNTRQWNAVTADLLILRDGVRRRLWARRLSAAQNRDGSERTSRLARLVHRNRCYRILKRETLESE